MWKNWPYDDDYDHRLYTVLKINWSIKSSTTTTTTVATNIWTNEWCSYLMINQIWIYRKKIDTIIHHLQKKNDSIATNIYRSAAGWKKNETITTHKRLIQWWIIYIHEKWTKSMDHNHHHHHHLPPPIIVCEFKIIRCLWWWWWWE